MEGNLKGARHSLSSTGLSSRYSYTSQYTRQAYHSGNQQSTPVHSRAASEASVPSPVPSLPTPHPTYPNPLPKRASSAFGSFASGLGVLDRTASLRGAKSQEAMRESRLKHWILDDGTVSSQMDLSRSASSVGYHYATRGSPTPSDSTRRPASQASEIRAQMNELKDKISEIKVRARESRRASALSIRSSSQFGSENSNPSSDTNRASGVAYQKEPSSPDSPVIEEFAVKKQYRQSVISYHGTEDTEEYPESHYEDAEETLDDLEEELQRNGPHSNGLGIYPTHAVAPEPYMGDILEELPEEDEDVEHGSESGHSEYYEAEAVVAERHEDRADAFDYEHFFLHSAMGSYSRSQRRDSCSSGSSIETTRPVSPARTTPAVDPDSEGGVTVAEYSGIQDSPLSAVHERNMSTESISTTASFETATEGVDPYDEGEEGGYDELDAVTQQALASTSRPQSTSWSHDRHSLSPRKHPGPSPLLPPPSPPSMLASPVPDREFNQARPSSTLLGSFIGLDSMDSVPEVVRRDRALVESVVTALQKCCLELQRSRNGKREDWRERLVEAQRILEGLDDEF
jgi:hypothetical protein